MTVRYTSEIFASAASYSVSYFSDLPSQGQLGQKVAVTNESLFDNSYPVIVVYEFSVSSGYYWTTGWKLLNARCSYTNLGAVEFNSGNWVGTATISTSPNATILDTTYNESWTWNSAQNIFVPSYLGDISIDMQKRIQGNSTTLESGWSTILGTGCTLTTDGSKLTMYAQSASGLTYTSVVTFNDTGRTLTSNFYMKCLIARNNSTNFIMGTSGQIQMYFQYLSGPSTGRAVEFGDADTTADGSTDFTGVFFDRISLTKYTAAANRGDVLTTETLLQFRVIAGTAAQVKVGSGAWHDIAVATCRSFAGTSFTIGTLSTNSGLNKAQCTLRYLQAIKYT